MPRELQLRDGGWRDETVFILGGGPSLRAHGNLKEIIGKGRIIVINRALELSIEPDIWCWMDDIFYEWTTTGQLGQRMRLAQDAFHGLKLTRQVQSTTAYPDDVVRIPWSHGVDLGPSIDEGINVASNCGFMALNLAYCLAADPIVLIGFDCHGRGGYQTWWHEGYPGNPQPASVYDRYRQHFCKAADRLRDEGRIVWNASPGSSLTCFEIVDKLEVIFWRLHTLGRLH